MRNNCIIYLLGMKSREAGMDLPPNIFVDMQEEFIDFIDAE